MSSFSKRKEIRLPFARVIWNENMLWNGVESSCLNGAPRPLNTEISFSNGRFEKRLTS